MTARRPGDKGAFAPGAPNITRLVILDRGEQRVDEFPRGAGRAGKERRQFAHAQPVPGGGESEQLVREQPVTIGEQRNAAQRARGRGGAFAQPVEQADRIEFAGGEQFVKAGVRATVPHNARRAVSSSPDVRKEKAGNAPWGGSFRARRDRP